MAAEKIILFILAAVGIALLAVILALVVIIFATIVPWPTAPTARFKKRRERLNERGGERDFAQGGGSYESE